MRAVNPLARARGHGSAKHGVRHWWLQRATALLLIFLTAWLLYAMVSLSGRSYQEVLVFISAPFNAACAVLFVVTGLYHAMLGMQVVIEDYIHTPALEMFLQLAIKAACYIGMVLSVIYLLKIITA